MDALREAAVVGDLFPRDRRGPGPALRDSRRGRTYSYRDLITTAYKACNVLRYLGVAGGSLVEIEPDPAPQPIFTFFGAALLGASASFSPRVAPGPDAAPAAVIVPVGREGAFDLPPGTQLATYGGEPADPRTTHWEAEAWSENPTIPPYDVDTGDVLLSGADGVVTHGAALTAATTAVETMKLASGDRVGVRDPLGGPRLLAAGLLAPIAVGATVVLPGDDGEPPPSVDVAVQGGDTGGDDEAANGIGFEADAVFDADRIEID
ncbi:MAG: acetyl-CoA synthetase [Haloferacaceae archaeon]